MCALTCFTPHTPHTPHTHTTHTPHTHTHTLTPQNLQEAAFYSDEDKSSESSEEDSGDDDDDDDDDEATKKKKKRKKKPYVMDSDHRLLLKNAKPLLQSRNAAVCVVWEGDSPVCVCVLDCSAVCV